MNLMRLVYIVSLLFFMSVSTVFSQAGADGAAEPFQEIIDLFERGQYQPSLQKTLSMLVEQDTLSTLSRTMLHQYAAYNLIAMNRQEEAIFHVRKTLTLTPDLELDPLLISPKIIAVFQEVRQQMAQEPPPIETEPASLEPPAVVTTGQAVQRSLLFPGLGHLAVGQKTKGRVLLGTEALLISGLVWSIVQREQAYDDYMAQRTPASAATAYDDFQKWHQARTVLAFSAVAVWSYALFDISRYEPPADKLSLHLSPTLDAVQFSYRF